MLHEEISFSITILTIRKRPWWDLSLGNYVADVMMPNGEIKHIHVYYAMDRLKPGEVERSVILKALTGSQLVAESAKTLDSVNGRTFICKVQAKKEA